MMNDILTASGVGTCSAATITIGDPSSYSRQPDTFVQASIADVSAEIKNDSVQCAIYNACRYHVYIHCTCVCQYYSTCTSGR